MENATRLLEQVLQQRTLRRKHFTALDADMEISAVETPSDAKLAVDTALISANSTLHRTPSEPGSESEAVAKASEPKSLNDNRVYAEVYEHDVDHKLISGKIERFQDQGAQE